MKGLLEEITSSWVAATGETFTSHPVAQKIRTELPNLIKKYLCT